MRRSVKLLLSLFLLASWPEASHAQRASDLVICKQDSSGEIVLRSRRCRRGETRISNFSALKGDTGAPGAAGANGRDGTNGADGSLRIYGNGSAGELHITANSSITDPNLQYTNILVDVGVTLYVSSGTILRCSGTFRNRGTISVYKSGAGTSSDSNSSTLAVISRNSPAVGYVSRVAMNGEYGTSSQDLVGGAYGSEYDLATMRSILRPGPFGGGGGGGTYWSSDGAYGGGSLTVLAAGSLSNEGLIAADGDDGYRGTGGAGGGIIILASKTSVSNTGTIQAKGGKGGDSFSRAAAGGGGGGGIVHLLAPTITAGTITLSGGAQGSSATAVTNPLRSAGGCGGASGGYGGYGSDVNSSNSQNGAAPGGAGVSFTTICDPTSLF